MAACPSTAIAGWRSEEAGSAEADAAKRDVATSNRAVGEARMDEANCNADANALAAEPRHGGLDHHRAARGATFTVTGLGLPAREICEVSTGYIIEGVRMAIDKTVRVAHTQCWTTGADAFIWEIDLPAAATFRSV